MRRGGQAIQNALDVAARSLAAPSSGEQLRADPQTREPSVPEISPSAGEVGMPEQMRIGRVVAVCSFVVFVCTTAYAQTGTATERSNGGRSAGAITKSEGVRIFGHSSLGARVSINLRGSKWRPVEASNDQWSVFDGDPARASKGRSRKKAVLMGAAIGGGVGAGGGAYAVYVTVGDAEPPAFIGIGAAVGAACGFLISLF